jgi:hypothetical protein
LLFEAGHRGFQIFDMRQDLVQHEAMFGTQFFRLQGFEQILAAGAQAPGTVEDGMDGLIVQKGLDHGACGLPMQVGDQHIQADPGIGQHLVEPVLLRGQHPTELLALSCDQAQVADLGRRNERGPHQTRRASVASHWASEMSVLRPGTFLT